MKKFRFGIAIVTILLLSGCALFEQVGPIQVVIHDDHQEMVSTIKKQLEEKSELYDTIVIAAEDNILVTYKVNHLNRFQMKSIEKTLNDWLEKEYPDEDFILSSDYKIFLESYLLFEEWDEGSLAVDEAEKKLEKIIELKKELT
ncbi:sporulation protein [Jeotgalibacillus marinus]|uniref:Sporulation protein n=1 Tax=Jeotgalibacillus marinus TaxID=86667 RepID=A0ABV3Q396_9BACL